MINYKMSMNRHRPSDYLLIIVFPIFHAGISFLLRSPNRTFAADRSITWLIYLAGYSEALREHFEDNQTAGAAIRESTQRYCIGKQLVSVPHKHFLGSNARSPWFAHAICMCAPAIPDVRSQSHPAHAQLRSNSKTTFPARELAR